MRTKILLLTSMFKLVSVIKGHVVTTYNKINGYFVTFISSDVWGEQKSCCCHLYVFLLSDGKRVNEDTARPSHLEVPGRFP